MQDLPPNSAQHFKEDAYPTMNTLQRIVKNTAALLLADVTARLLGFVFAVWAARYLGPNGFGVLTFAIAFCSLFSVFADLGIGQLTIREVARDKLLAERYVGNTLALKLVLACVVGGAIAFTVNALDYPRTTILVVYIVTGSVLLSSFASIGASIFQAFEKMEYVLVGQVLGGIVKVAALYLVVRYGFGLFGVAMAYSLSALLLLLFNGFVVTRRFLSGIRVHVAPIFMRRMVIQALPFGLSLISITIYYRIDSVMLSLFHGETTVGLYNAAYTLVLSLAFIPRAFLGSLYPIMARDFHYSKEALSNKYEQSFKYLLMLAVPLGVGTTILSSRLIPAIYGPEYRAAIVVLQILVWSEVFVFLNVVFGTLFASIDKQSVVLKQTVAAAVLNVVLNAVVIPRYSCIGAAATTVATECFAFAVLFWQSRRHGFGLPKRLFVQFVPRVVLSTMAMGTVVLAFRGLSLAAIIPMAVVTYFVALWGVRGLDTSDKLLLLRLFNQRRKR